jgi:hypothetical protein
LLFLLSSHGVRCEDEDLADAFARSLDDVESTPTSYKLRSRRRNTDDAESLLFSIESNITCGLKLGADIETSSE